jgi:UDP-N-acetylglucosamine/UDP-N-acetylgalactosamine diphosphorylase
MPKLDELRPRLEAIGQAHVLARAGTLSPEQREALAKQLASFDLEQIPELVERYVRHPSGEHVPEHLDPAPYYPLDAEHGPRKWDRAAARAAGEALLRAGKVACFTVAGGQGSRLGYDGPKGCFGVGCVSGKPLFQIFAESVLATARRYGAALPWYIMTSPLNHDATEAFFEAHDFFGLPRRDVRFFQQGVMPSFDKATGRMLMAGPGEVATNPDGHGGAFRAMRVSGALDDMRARGVEHVSYFQVDNPHAAVADPVFLGLHAAAKDSSGEFSSKMVAKASWDEKVGVFCAVDGRVRVIEYSDLPAELAKATRPDGSLRFNAGSIAIHAIGVAFIEKVTSDPAFALPYHRAVKKVPCVDPETGKAIEPGEPNGVKLERFVFDGIPMARASIVVETDRTAEFAPVKNATGADSVESSKALQTERAARWLSACGVKIPRRADGSVDATIEIAPLTALDADQLRSAKLPATIEPGARVLL